MTNHHSRAQARSRGQAMLEYAIIVALIATAAIGTYSFFGKTLRNQMGAIAAALGGDGVAAKRANDNGHQSGKDAADQAAIERNMANFNEGTDAK